MTPALIVAGSPGVGKSVVGMEASYQLSLAGVSHAFIDSDALDYIVPGWFEGKDTTELCARNLSSMWSNFEAAGAEKLILCGVFVRVVVDLTWIRRAIPNFAPHIVRLSCGQEALLERLAGRERGSQLERNRAGAERYRRLYVRELDPLSTLQIDTTGRCVADIAREALQCTGWLPENATND